ncbi:SusC/RagA family TonB-linked outer membrane protein [Aquiflexum sp.]|uniref:SusC/RagA family TonB-linked outer membrane protein n=1 Tax=Aquiflexum sp. TaxID=1872584 RepID=UPI0035933E74
MRTIILLTGLFLICSGNIAQTIKFDLEGKVSAKTTGEPLPGAIISPGDFAASTISDENGNYKLTLDAGKYILTVSYLGFEKQQHQVDLKENTVLNLEMLVKETELGGVEIMATGYQEIPRERATGSFVTLDRDLVNRRVSTNLIDRLEDVTPGLIFNRTGPANDPISIRGRNTLFANTQPLIIIDNFPYDGPLDNINPNDVESITVLRDASAASIWGAKAGNGVIVITTKKGFESAPRFSFNSNINIIGKLDLFYRPVMGMDDFIDLEIMLFNRNFYNSSENSFLRPPLSPGVEAMIQARNGLISEEELDLKLAMFRTKDTRRELMEHFYRPAVNQQYALNLSGGTSNFNYTISAGTDRNLENIIGNRNTRYTFNNRNNWKLLKGRLDLGTGIYFAKRQVDTRTISPDPDFPYEVFTDREGNPVPITRQLSRRYVDSMEGLGLLDWNYIPLNEIGRSGLSSVQDDIRINFNAGYELLPGLKAEGFYQYWTNSNSTENLQTTDLFSTRDFINRYTVIGDDGKLTYPVPMGSIFDQSIARSYSHSLRTMLRYNKSLGMFHRIDAIAGWELKDFQMGSRNNRYYGYRENIGLSQPVDFVNNFRILPTGQQQRIFDGAQHRGTVDRFVSGYFNAGYSYKKRYNLSMSARRDASNLFGVETNQRAVPLWSTGLGWIISEEEFFSSGWLPFLKFRATYGENGNVDKSVSALTTAQFSTNNILMLSAGEPAANIFTPENRLLRWERIKILNFGLDFESRNNRIRGQVEAYFKTGTDLIGDTPYTPSTGFALFRANTASTESRGVDIDLQSLNIDREFNWTTNFLLSSVHEKVTDYFFENSPVQYLSQMNQLVPLEGRPMFSIYSIPWGGLNPDTGAPMGILDGETSENYSAIFSNLTTETLQFHGPRRPTIFGAVRNNFSYRNFDLSVNISYRMGYYYQRESILYGLALTGRGGHADFERRWQNPGDEIFTQVPSMPAANNALRDNTYRYSDHLVERGDHVRLQDIRFSYRIFGDTGRKLPFRSAEIYTYANNIGLVWKKSKDPIDPDFREILPPASIAFGLNVNF